MKKELIQEVSYLLDEAEERVWIRAEKVMVELYWDIGYCLKDCDDKEILAMSKQLGKMLEVEEKFFEIAYHFYKDNPIKKKALVVKK